MHDFVEDVGGDMIQCVARSGLAVCNQIVKDATMRPAGAKERRKERKKERKWLVNLVLLGLAQETEIEMESYYL